MSINLQHFYPIIDQQNNLVFLANGNISLGYALELPEIFSLSEKAFEKLHNSWFQALKALPVGTVVHKQDVYLKKEFDAKALTGTSFLSKATSKHFEGRQRLEHRSYLFFTWPMNRTFSRPRMANPFVKTPKTLPTQLNTNTQHFIAAVGDAVGYLNNTGNLELKALSPEYTLTITNQYFNGFQMDSDTDIRLKDGELRIGNRRFGMLAVNHESCFGEGVQSSKPNPRFTSDEISFHQGFLDDLGLELYEDHVVNQILYLDDRNRWMAILNKKREELLKSVNFGTQNRIFLDQIEETLETISKDDQSRLIRGQVNILFAGEDGKEVSRISSVIKTGFKELDIKPYEPAGPLLYQYFLNSYFGHSAGFSNDDLYVTDIKHALCLWINNTGYHSDKEGILFNDRIFNSPVIKDVWDNDKKRIKARNFAIFAPTGEGKSFLANNILRQFYEAGTRLVIIDLGGSYSKFAKLYPDDHIILRYEHGKNLGINPFYIERPDDLGPERIEDLCGFLLELYASGLKVAKEGQVALKKILQFYYEQNSSPYSLHGFYEFVTQNHEDFESRLGIGSDYFNPGQFLHIMSEYVGDGMYGFLFESSLDQAYKLEDKRMIIFELDEVRDNKEILSVMLKLIKSAVQRTIWKNRDERGIILFDEFAKQLKFENVLESVEFYYQAIRKQEGAIGIILQSINQLPENATAASILENTQVIYSLHNEKGYKDLSRRLNLSAHDLNQLHSIRNNLKGKRKYTEIFIKIGKESNIFRLEVPPEVYAAYLTDGKENQAIMAIYNKTQNMERAITEFLTTKTATL
nr:TraG family conjugative transposon ATPase [Salegentibacter lacus]